MINLGDSIQDANDHDADVKSLSTVAEKFKEFRCPYYMVLGNHDLKMFDSTREAEAIFGYDSFTYSLDLGGYHLIFLTNEVRPELGTAGGGTKKTHSLAEKDLVWLREDLQKTDKPCLIFTHYVFFEKVPGAGIQNAEQVVDVLHKSGKVLAAFSGHTHQAYSEKRSGIAYHVLGSPIADLQETGTPDKVYYEVDLRGSEITVTEHLFDID